MNVLSPLSVSSEETIGEVEQAINKDVNQSLSVTEIIAKIKHRSVRDLAWVIGCPSILSSDIGSDFPKDDFYERMLNCSLESLTSLDINPQPLEDFLAQAKTKRLGEKFERFWQFWLNCCEGWKIIAADYQMSNDDRTLGAFDLVLEEPSKTGHSHWELAVKFYLNTDFGSRMSSWYGTNKKDRLDKKLNRMQEHQLKLATYPAVKKQLDSKNWQIERTKGIVKGRLFWKATTGQRQFPSWVNSKADYGFWCSATEFKSTYKENILIWYLLDKKDWLSPIQSRDTENLKLLNEEDLNNISHSFDSAIQIVGCDKVSNNEEKRFFIVPDDWILSLE